jgi:hypothetical protein
VCTGSVWHDHAVSKGIVLYVVAEGAGGFCKRISLSIPSGDATRA